MNAARYDVGIIGAGAWGTAVAMHLARKGLTVLLWAYEKDLCETLRITRENSLYLPSFTLPRGIDFTDDLPTLARSVPDIVVAAPSYAVRSVLAPITGLMKEKHVLILTKGFETETLMPISKVVEEAVGGEFSAAVLSGPSFAREVADGAFTSVVISSRNDVLSHYLQKRIHDDNFRVYTSRDVTGVELGGAMKNVMAIGAGIIDGLNLGTNTKAAFITRALAEIKRLGKALGAKETTFMGLSGMGDLILTAYGNLSRNRAFGMELAAGKKADHIISTQKTVVEGYYTIKAAHALAGKWDIEMPITNELYKIVYEGKDLAVSFREIKTRVLREEDE
ncbi:MAG TPA: NAD(P)H-dependent glycerol-3-phosphate dehydrogenase [Syntrophorhabdaceae bacterium]|jgi:glycerol-3-phosphate dehydrogenase (NAD(P)+)